MYQTLMNKFKALIEEVPVSAAAQIAFGAQLIKEATTSLNAKELVETLNWVANHVAYGEEAIELAAA